MSTEVTPESLRTHAKWLRDAEGWSSQAHKMDAVADDLEREQRPLPTVPGWYPGIVVERGGESCTGALLTDEGEWIAARSSEGFHISLDPRIIGQDPVTIRWAEQDGKTPGQTARRAYDTCGFLYGTCATEAKTQESWEKLAAAVLAAHGTPTLTPVGEHPEPGTRGLLPVVLDDDEWGSGELGMFLCTAGSAASRAILADPRPDGAHE